MFAINHAATALVIKKAYGTVPMIWILISVQIMELLWVVMNFIGLERTTTDREVQYVGNIHLSKMPYSHSIEDLCLTFPELSFLLTIPGFGPEESSTVLSAIGDPYRFSKGHHHQRRVLPCGGPRAFNDQMPKY